jgi:16S rRNA processing protein RimM
MVTVGRIGRPHGNRGRVFVMPETDFASDRFEAGQVFHVLRDDTVSELIVADSRTHDGRWIVGFADVESIDAAEALRGLELRIAADALRSLGPGAYYVHDMVGCAVRTLDGEDVGTVARVMLDTGVPVLVVTTTDDGDEVLVPFAEAICRRVDVAARVIEIAPPEGLIGLNRKQT